MRRSMKAAVAAVLGLALAGCGGGDEGDGDADGPETTTVVLGTQPTADHLAIYLAMEQGFFSRTAASPWTRSRSKAPDRW